MSALLAAWLVGMCWASRPGGVQVLLYHRVRTREAYDAIRGAERNFSIPSDRFRAQLERLKNAGYRFIGLDETYAILNGDAPASGLLACVTFDDGSESTLSKAHPILQELDIPATVFVTTDPASWVFEVEPRLQDTEIQMLHQGGWTIGSHCVSHNSLIECSPDELNTELQRSRRSLEELLNRPVPDLAIPLNFHNRRIRTACLHAGYRTVFTADPGILRAGCDPGAIPRIAIEGQLTAGALLRTLTPFGLVQRRVINTLKRLPPRLLGGARWMPIRAWLFRSRVGRYLTYAGIRRALIAAGILWLIAMATLATNL